MKNFIVLVGLLAFASTANANPSNLTFIAFQTGGWQVGYPYTVAVNGNLTAMMCDDWVHGGTPGDMWQANFNNLGADSLLTELRFNQLPEALTLYREAGWLLLETEVTPRVQWTDINFAVWHVFDSAVPLNQSAHGWFDLAQQEALKGFPGVDFRQVGIYTPLNEYDTNPNDPQEFLTIVPEPSTLILLGSGIAGLVARKRLT
jgi:PEP-CTERM motif